MITKEELAKLLNGWEYAEALPSEIKAQMKGTDLVIVNGASDDLVEFRGAVYDECGGYEGATVPITKNGLLENQCDADDCPYYAKLWDLTIKTGSVINARWCAEPDISWTFETNIPHDTFLMMEDGEIFCRGIVFNLNDVI